jgi:hypothetical protein
LRDEAQQRGDRNGCYHLNAQTPSYIVGVAAPNLTSARALAVGARHEPIGNERRGCAKAVYSAASAYHDARPKHLRFPGFVIGAELVSHARRLYAALSERVATVFDPIERWPSACHRPSTSIAAPSG